MALVADCHRCARSSMDATNPKPWDFLGPSLDLNLDLNLSLFEFEFGI